MIKINNKRTLITLAILATLILLAQPVQALDIKVIPQHLRLVPNSNGSINNSSFFCWRYIGSHKILTIEEGNPDTPINLRDLRYFRDVSALIPSQFIRQADFPGRNINEAAFNLRQYTFGQTDLWVVTVEQLGYLNNGDRTFEVTPLDLAGTNSFVSGGVNEQTKFKVGSLKVKDDSTQYVVLLVN